MRVGQCESRWKSKLILFMPVFGKVERNMPTDRSDRQLAGHGISISSFPTTLTSRTSELWEIRTSECPADSPNVRGTKYS